MVRLNQVKFDLGEFECSIFALGKVVEGGESEFWVVVNRHEVRQTREITLG